MQSVDLNLLTALDALLQEGSVTGAARRLHLTAPAVSRSLARLRVITGDPLLVRAGRRLVPTEVAHRLRDPAREALAAVHDVLTTAHMPSDDELQERMDRLFTVRSGPDNASGFGPALTHIVHQRAPQVRLTFTNDCDDAASALRDGHVDLVVGGPPIEPHNDTLHRETLFQDTVVVIARRDGAFARTCGDREPTISDIAGQPHVNRSPRSTWHDELDRHLTTIDLARQVVATTPGFAAAFSLLRRADLICLAPDRLTRSMIGDDLRSWKVPVALPPLIIEQAWHHRTHTDPEHRWLRQRMREAAQSTIVDLELDDGPTRQHAR